MRRSLEEVFVFLYKRSNCFSLHAGFKCLFRIRICRSTALEQLGHQHLSYHALSPKNMFSAVPLIYWKQFLHIVFIGFLRSRALYVVFFGQWFVCTSFQCTLVKSCHVLVDVVGLYAGPSNAQAQFNRKIQSSVIQTMIPVCTFYAVAWMPEKICVLLIGLHININFQSNAYYVTLSPGFLYICTNVMTTIIEHYSKVVRVQILFECMMLDNGFHTDQFYEHHFSIYRRQPIQRCHKISSGQTCLERFDCLQAGIPAD